MFTIIAALYQDCLRSFEYNVCLLGLEQTGKTTLLNTIKRVREVYPDTVVMTYQYKPTVGLNVAKYRDGTVKLTLWDLGGKANLRKIWYNYYSDCHGLVYVLDERLREGVNQLEIILMHPYMIRIPILILVPRYYLKLELEKILKNCESLTYRKVAIEIVNPFDCKSKKAAIRYYLNWLYKSIRELHEYVKS